MKGGTTMNAKERLNGKDSSFAILSAAVERVKHFPFDIRIRVENESVGRLNSFKRFCPKSDCKDANLNTSRLSLSIIKLTEELQKLQTPSNRIILLSVTVINKLCFNKSIF
jgi:hypothetical protein